MNSRDTGPIFYAEIGERGEVAWLWKKRAPHMPTRALKPKEAAQIRIDSYRIEGASVAEVRHWQRTVVARLKA